MQFQRVSLLVVLGIILIVEPSTAQGLPAPIPIEPGEAPSVPPRPARGRDHEFEPFRQGHERSRERHLEIADRLDDILTSDQSDELRDALRDGEDFQEALSGLDLSNEQREEIRDVFEDTHPARYR